MNPEKQVLILTKALEFYANEDNYDEDCAPFYMETSHECVHEFITQDLGGTARKALLHKCNATVNQGVINANSSPTGDRYIEENN